jgi:NADH:ubiquinone oxidoreductase subunit 6 (subunit J)
MNKIIKIALVALGLISAVTWYFLPGSEVPAGEAANSWAISGMFTITFLLLGIAVVVSLVFSLLNLFSSPQSLKKTLVVLGAFLVVLVFSYLLASGTDVNLDEMANRGINTTETIVKRIGTGLNLFFFLVAIAIGAMLIGGVKKMTNK